VSETLERLRSVGADGLSERLQEAGVSGAGGGGFPSYVKWESLADARYLLVNHQESEPNCYLDKWIGREYADELADLFEALLAEHLECVVVGAKWTDRDPWLRPLEAAVDGTVYEPDDLPFDPEEATGVVFAYTEDTYEYGMENVLMRVSTGTVIGKDLPVDYGWIVQNTETVYNIYQALIEERPVLRTHVHVDGLDADGKRLTHRLLDVPVGTSAADLLAAAGADTLSLPADRVLLAGGPGWCFRVQRPPDRWGARKRTNCLLLFDEVLVSDNTYGNGRVNVLDTVDWVPSDPETEPTRIDPDRLHVPIVTNERYRDLVAPSTPTVSLGDGLERGQRLADPTPAGDGFCVAHHAPVDGRVVDVTPREVELRRTA
jgi:Na+-translocating ferredoxin:NAD+ oxidoreductase RnfC subunit